MYLGFFHKNLVTVFADPDGIPRAAFSPDIVTVLALLYPTVLWFLLSIWRKTVDYKIRMVSGEIYYCSALFSSGDIKEFEYHHYSDMPPVKFNYFININ